MTFDKSKDASIQLITNVNTGMRKGHALGDRVSITHLYNRLRGRETPTHPLDITAEPGHYVGLTLGFLAGLMGGIRNVATRQFLNHNEINDIEKHLNEIKSHLDTTGEKSAARLLNSITEAYELMKTSVSSISSQNLANQLKLEDTSIENKLDIKNKLDQIINYINPRNNINPTPYFNLSYNSNNGKKLFNIIAGELDAFKKRCRQSEIASIRGMNKALKQNDEHFKEKGLPNAVRAFMKPS